MSYARQGSNLRPAPEARIAGMDCSFSKTYLPESQKRPRNRGVFDTNLTLTGSWGWLPETSNRNQGENESRNLRSGEHGAPAPRLHPGAEVGYVRGGSCQRGSNCLRANRYHPTGAARLSPGYGPGGSVVTWSPVGLAEATPRQLRVPHCESDLRATQEPL